MNPVNFLFMKRLSMDLRLQNEEVDLKIKRNIAENFGETLHNFCMCHVEVTAALHLHF